MTRVRFKIRTDEEQEPAPTARHRSGVCECTKGQRRILRYYLGYGFCGFCQKLTPHQKWRRVG